MSIDIYAAQSLPPADLTRVAEFVADFTNGPAGLEARLLPLEAAEVGRRVGLVACEGNEFRGYAGMSPSILDETRIELGPFIVPPEYRRKGIGVLLVTAAVSAALRGGLTPYVFGNDANIGNLTRAGLRPRADKAFPAQSFALCQTTCRLYNPGDACCSIPVMYDGEVDVADIFAKAWPADRQLRMP